MAQTDRTETTSPGTTTSTTGSSRQAAAPDRERGMTTGREGDGGRRGAGLARQGAPPAMQAGPGGPAALMQRMAEDMDRLFEQLGFGRGTFGLAPLGRMGLERDLFGGPALPDRTDRALWSPQVELFRRGDQLVVRADLPGMKKEDLHVEVEDDLLTISGERRDEHEERREGLYRSERHYGQFHRVIPLPEGVDASRCEAHYADGVLEVTLPAPKEPERQARRIQIR